MAAKGLRDSVHHVHLALSAIAFVACYMPWLWHSAAALSPGALDLAEWASLIPAMRNGPVALLPSFLLRSCVGLLAAAIWIGAISYPQGNRTRWIAYGMAIYLAVALLPPADFLSGSHEDPNYRQQFGIAAALVAGMAGTFFFRAPLRKRVPAAIAAVSFVGAVCAVAGLLASTSLAEIFGTPLTPGVGSILFALATVGCGGHNLLAYMRSRN